MLYHKGQKKSSLRLNYEAELKGVVHHVFNFIQILTAVSTSLEPI